jgi:hypothetical protein
MNTVTKPFLPPSRYELAAERSKDFWRGVTAETFAAYNKVDGPIDFVEREWGLGALPGIRRAASAVTTTTDFWGQNLVPISVGQTLISLAPDAAFTKLQALCMQLDFTGVERVLIPVLKTPVTATWIAEGNSASMPAPVFSAVTVGPLKKVLFGASASLEIFDYSSQNAVPAIQNSLQSAATTVLDSTLLGSAAADANQPAGLLLNVSNLGATAATNGQDVALGGDLGKIAAAMATAKISAAGMALLLNPGDAPRFYKLVQPAFLARYNVFETLAVTAGSIVGVAPAGVAMSVGSIEIEPSRNAVVQLADDPQNTIDGTAVAGRVVSSFQAGLIAWRCRVRATWQVLVTGAVQLITSVNW